MNDEQEPEAGRERGHFESTERNTLENGGILGALRLKKN